MKKTTEEHDAEAEELEAEPEKKAEAAEPEEPQAEAETETAEAEAPEPEAGLGVVEGAEVVEAQQPARKFHEVGVEAADEAETVGDEVAAAERDEPPAEA